MGASTLSVIFLFFTVVTGSIHGGPTDSTVDVGLHEAQRRQSPINFGFRIMDSIQGLLGVTQPEKPQRMPKTPSRFIHLNPASAQTPPPPLQTTQFPQFPTPHPALAVQPTLAAAIPGNSVESQPGNHFVGAHTASLQPNSVPQGHFNVPGPVQGNTFGTQFVPQNNAFSQHSSAIPAQFANSANQINSIPQSQISPISQSQLAPPNSILPQQSHLFSPNTALNTGLESTSSSQIFSHQSSSFHGSEKTQTSVQQNFVSSTAVPSTTSTNLAFVNAGSQSITGTPVTIPNSLLQLQPPNIETNAPSFRFQDSSLIQTGSGTQSSSAISEINNHISSPISTGHSHQSGQNILPVNSLQENAIPAPPGSISPEVLRGEFSTFTNDDSPGLVLKIPNSMLIKNLAKDKLTTGLKSASNGINQTPDSFVNPQQHHEPLSLERAENTDEIALASEKLLSQLLSTNEGGGIIPTEAVIHLNTGSSNEDTESLSFKELPKKQLKQKLHFGGWVGVPQEKEKNGAKSLQTASGFEFSASNVPAQTLNFVSQQSVNNGPIFIPPTQLVPPLRDFNPTSASTLGKDLIRGSSFQSLPQNNNLHPSPHFQDKQKSKQQNFSSAVDFLQKGSKTNKNSQNSVAHQKIMTILRPHVQSQDLKLTTELDPTVFGIYQTLQPPDLGDSSGQHRTDLNDPNEEFFTITVADDSVSSSLESLLLDDSTVAVEHDDDTGTLSFTQVIDNANPAQVEQAQQLITAIPAINVSHLLHSDINSTHAYDTELTLKSLLSFRKKPRRIQSSESQVGLLQEIPNHLSSSVQLSSFVTPPSIEILDFSGFSNFHNKQGPKLPPPLNLQQAFQTNAMHKVIPYTNSSLIRSKSISSNDRKKRHETRFNKVNGDSFRTSISQDEIWSINNQPPSVPRLPSTGMSPPPLPKAPTPFLSAPIIGLRAPDQIHGHHQHHSPHTVSPLLELSNLFPQNHSQDPASGNGVPKEDGKQLLLPSVVLQPPVASTDSRITPKPEHQFGAVIQNVPSANFGTVVETTHASAPIPSNDQLNQFLPPVTSNFIANSQGQVRTNGQRTSNQNPLFQGQLANFPTIIVSQHQRPLEPQLPGNSQNPFQNAHFNQVQNSQSPQQPQSTQQNQFRQGTFTGNPVQQAQNAGNNVIKTEIIPHQSGTHGTAFDFLNNPAPLVHQIPVTLVQTTVPRRQNFSPLRNNKNNQNVDLKRIITGLDGPFSQNVPAITKEKSIGGNSITVHDSSQTRNLLWESQLVRRDNGTTNNATSVTTAVQPTSKQENTFDQFRQQTFHHRVTPVKSTTSPILNQVQQPRTENQQKQTQFGTQSTTRSAKVTLRPFISTSTSFPRFASVGSGTDIKTPQSSLPESTTSTAAGIVETNLGNDGLSDLSTTLAPWSRRFRGQFMTSRAPSRRIPTESQRIELISNTSSTTRPQTNVGLPFTPWPSSVTHGRRLTTLLTTTTTNPPSTTQEAKTFKPAITWPPIRPRFPSSTTTTIQPTITSTQPPEKSTSASIFETWLRTHQLTTTLPPSLQVSASEPNSGNISLEKEAPQSRSIGTVKTQNLSQKRRRNFPRLRSRPSSRPGVPEYIAQETKYRPVSVPPASDDDSLGVTETVENNERTTTATPVKTVEIVTVRAANESVTLDPDETDFVDEDFVFISTKTSQ